jgi:hypothetical protein
LRLSSQHAKVPPQLDLVAQDDEASVKPLAPQFDTMANSPLQIRRIWIRDTRRHLRNDFDREEGFEVVLEYACALAVKEPVFRVVFALPDERRVAVVGWYPGPGRYIESGTGRLRFVIKGGVLYPRRYVLHTSIASTEGVAYDVHYGVCDLYIKTGDVAPPLRTTDDLAACLSYTAEREW